jgi:hypothetical protein
MQQAISLNFLAGERAKPIQNFNVEVAKNCSKKLEMKINSVVI